MPRECRWFVALGLGALLAGCASSGGVDGTPKAREVDRDAKESAILQVKLGQGYLTEGELETARDKLQRALELDPTSVDAHTLMAVLNERINRPQVAEKFYRRAAELKPEDGSVNNNYGAFLCASGRFDEAEPYFLRALDDAFYRTPAVAYANAGMCALKAGNTERAELYLRQAIELQPDNRSALFELARISFSRGQRSDLMRARAFLQRYEATSAEIDPEALDLGARIEDGMGDAAAAAEYRRRLVSEFPQYTPAAASSDGMPSS